jgi:hypothetical protein
MSIRHKETAFPRGDTWIIAGRLFGRDGQPLALPVGGVFLEWALINESRAKITGATSDDYIAITDRDSGLIEITVPPGITAQIGPGAYSDALRATVAGTVSTMWNGPIIVEGSPFVS